MNTVCYDSPDLKHNSAGENNSCSWCGQPVTLQAGQIVSTEKE